MKNPPHPGDLIRTEVIEALGLSVSKAAAILKVGRATLPDLLHGKAALTPEMALRIEKAFGPDMNHLLRMQFAYDVAKTREHARGILDQTLCPGLKRTARISYMFQNGFRIQSRSMSVHREGRS
jgi:addiction module HigA family antidote